ncbi:bifunctional 2',3'-cyclic-nucleotide 2'-phosphodiesterase/3'-nucleotidase [Bacillus tianshenii]|nr:bifunctional 2',3'-cyclic-nucleotide 2'-phosphodiesterase/3'-nucleotidase [Bacillus tianshenii]
MSKFPRNVLAGTALAIGLFAAPLTGNAAEEDQVNLRLLETTDIHVNLLNYDYYKDAPTDKFGLNKTATLIKEARQESQNSMLLDNGDILQGNPLGDYVAQVKPLEANQVHPAYEVLNLLGYDVGTLGNHEFNYGLDFLQQNMQHTEFPLINANVYVDDGDEDPSNDENYFKPYVILDRTVVDEDGEEHQLKVGVIGFTPPQIMQWDKAHLQGKVKTKGIIETANKFVPQMKNEGADIVVALSHSGIGSVTQERREENATYDLTKVEGIDAVLSGHEHSVFPSVKYKDMQGVDINKGTINGTVTVMPGSWGSHLGVVDLQLEKEGENWTILDSKSEARSIVDQDGNPTVKGDKQVEEAVQDLHQETVEYVRSPVGETTAPINSYFALVKDDPSVQIVTNAQKWYVENYLKGTEYEGTPILSAGAPFKAGTRGDPSYYTDVPKGTIAIKNVADLYLYPNTLKAVEMNGAQVKEWLEMSAGQFNQIDPNSEEEQQLINQQFRTYNFDIIDGISYQIDVTEPAKYDGDGNIIQEDANRIVNVTYNGKPVKDEQEFIVATNNYRAGGGGNFPGFEDANIVVDSADENRQIIIDYIRKQGTINPTADQNWSFAPIKGNANVTFQSSPQAQKYAKEMSDIQYITTLENGFGKYRIEIDKEKGKKENEQPKKEKQDKGVEKEKNKNKQKKMVYTVKKGDNLYRIGLKYEVDWKKIAHYNNLKDPTLINIGQQIRIPK